MNPAKAATITGSAYRDHLDHAMMAALRKEHWCPGSRMVQCEPLNTAGAKRFFVRVAYLAAWGNVNQEITVHYDLTGDEFKAAKPETFEILGKLLATMANEKLEAVFMSIG
jgi:hypothetical protein